ncbi:MAG: DUF393 domain-containing protein [Verrucomicrobia bacterium]|nr:DUF393 domain-containing protein [Verrucomicrobiota bacterium]
MKLKKSKTSKHLVLFDDSCPLCWRSVNKILAWDKKGVFHFAPIRDETAKLVLKNRYKELKDANTLILVEDYSTRKPRTWIRGRAVMRIFWLLGGWKKLIGWAAFIPYGIDPFYSLVAKRRHRFK